MAIDMNNCSSQWWILYFINGINRFNYQNVTLVYFDLIPRIITLLINAKINMKEASLSNTLSIYVNFDAIDDLFTKIDPTSSLNCEMCISSTDHIICFRLEGKMILIYESGFYPISRTTLLAFVLPRGRGEWFY